jgi:hypothetical protein
VALLSLEQALLSSEGETPSPLTSGEMLKAVERTRMVVSTVSTFISLNAERAFKAADEYTRSQVVKKITGYYVGS